MTTIDFITELFCQVDDQMTKVPKHPQALLWPSEAVTVGLLYAIKGVSTRAFYRWLSNNYQPLFPKLPHRTRHFRRSSAISSFGIICGRILKQLKSTVGLKRNWPIASRMTG
jgi:hypothetical protein